MFTTFSKGFEHSRDVRISNIKMQTKYMVNEKKMKLMLHKKKQIRRDIVTPYSDMKNLNAKKCEIERR